MKKITKLLFLVFITTNLFSQAPFPFEDTFESGVLNPDWWSPMPDLVGVNGLVELQNNIGLNNSKGVIMVKSDSNTGAAFNGLDLFVDLSGQTEVELSFWIRDYYDENQIAEGIYFSDNGGDDFSKVIDFFPEEWCDYVYGMHPPIDVDRLAMEAGLELTSQFVIRFMQVGDGDVNNDGFYIDNVRVYDPELEYTTIPFEDNFNTGVFKKAWAQNFADATSTIVTGNAITNPMNYVRVTNDIGVNNSYGVQIGRECNGTLTTNALDLHLNLLNESDVEMTFWIRDYYDENQVDEGIYFSDDGGDNFTKIVDFFPEEWCDYVYGMHPPIDVDGLAMEAGLELTSQFVIRFQQVGDGDVNNDGFYIDNVRVYDPELEYASIPFEDNFNTGVLKKAWAQNFADATSTIVTGNAITNPMNYVRVTNDIGVNNSYGVQIGRECNGTLTTNALDLHLNLLNESDVEMTFWIRDYYDENQVDEGIYFSDDGGDNFTKIVDFFPEEWCDYVYGMHPPIDVDGLAMEAGLELTSQFVIRFQQVGDGDVNNDGFYIDDVRVYDPELEYASIPFEDNFNTGVLKKAWAQNFADATSTINSNSAITSPMNLVEVQNGIGIDNSFGVIVSRQCSGVFSTNALDLHLNLTGTNEVNLTFLLADLYDDTDDDDGIYISDDNGNSFTKIYDFDFSNTPDYVYEQYEINISDFIIQHSLEFSDKFIIRFQQRGEGNSNNDGFYLDNVNVNGMSTSITDFFAKGNLIVFPNPTDNILNVKFGETPVNRVEKAIIIDVLGVPNLPNLIQRNDGLAVDLSNMENGIYFLTIFFDDGATKTKRIVKE